MSLLSYTLIVLSVLFFIFNQTFSYFLINEENNDRRINLSRVLSLISFLSLVILFLFQNNIIVHIFSIIIFIDFFVTLVFAIKLN